MKIQILGTVNLLEIVTTWLTTLSVFYILYPLLFVKNLKQIPSSNIIPQFELNFGDLSLPLISIFLLLGGGALGVYSLASELSNFGENIHVILLCLCVGIPNFIMRFLD